MSPSVVTVVPPERLTALADLPVDPSRAIVLYWQVMARRTRHNFALEQAVAHARALGRPLVVLEALRAGYAFASDRLHRFALDGMTDDAEAYAAAGVTHVPYVEPEPGAGRGLLEALAARACVVVTDDHPEFFLPRMLAAAGDRLARQGTRLEAIDGNGLLPLRSAGRAWPSAPHFRRMLQKTLPEQLGWFPAAEPLAAARALPSLDADTARWLHEVRRRWPAPDPALLSRDPRDAAAARRALAALPIDHDVPPVEFAGGQAQARRALDEFMARRYATYGERRNAAEDPSNSRLSPYLHWGFVSAHEVFAAVAERERWSPLCLAPKPTGKREGWWGMGASGESFLDELVTWRELSFNTAHFVAGHDEWRTLPEWARATLDRHRGDPRPAIYGREALEAGATYDELWNATQGQLRAEGRIWNYLRMLWGKKVLEWTQEPEEALAHLLAINDRWALDGRDPNSTSGITWVFGRYDRPWGPERPIIGTTRPMSSAATARKMRVGGYVARYGRAAGAAGAAE